MPAHFSHDVVAALKDAVVKVFWTKEDMRRVLNIADVDQALLASQDWNLYKYHILSPIVDVLNTTDTGIGALRRLLFETLRYKDCKHLLRFNNGKVLKKDAENALEHLRALTTAHDQAVKTAEEERELRRKRMEIAKKESFFQNKLGELHTLYMTLLTAADEKKRGFDLEALLNQMFALFELSPHAPFRRVGEQIDGAFILNGDNFLLEAKWQKTQVNLNDLRDLDGAVGSSLDNTLGLFLSIEGFSQQGLDGYISGHRPRLVCMDGEDLMLVLEGRIDLGELLSRKKDIASQRRQIYVTANDIIMGRG